MPTDSNPRALTLARKVSRLDAEVYLADKTRTPKLLGRALSLLVEHHDTCAVCRIGVVGQRLGIACREVERITVMLCQLERRLPRHEPGRQLALFDCSTDPAPAEPLPF